jgi:hypothetical protein
VTNEQRARIRAWVENLRSGEYLQASGQLYDPEANDGQGGYCCLGVAMEVAQRLGCAITGNRDDWGGTGYLPQGVQAWYGFADGTGDPVVSDSPDPDDAITAIGANDRLGWSFSMIADALERRYLTDPDGS